MKKIWYDEELCFSDLYIPMKVTMNLYYKTPSYSLA